MLEPPDVIESFPVHDVLNLAPYKESICLVLWSSSAPCLLFGESEEPNAIDLD